MPSDYISTAQALSLSPTPSPDPHLSPTTSSPQQPPSYNDQLPSWARPPAPGSGSGSGSGSSDDLFRSGTRLPGVRRLSTPYSRGRRDSAASHRPLGQRLVQGSTAVTNQLIRLGYSMTPVQRVISAVVGLLAFVLAILFLVFSSRIFAALRPVAEGWRNLPGGWIILFLLSAISAFPPLIGYSMTITLAGFVFGFPAGWPIVATATVAGSTAAFVASRTVFAAYVQRLVGEDRRFVALGQVLRRDGLPVLVAIRFCPLPFSLSNGFLATIPSISPARFALATALSTPKLLVHVFIGDRLAQLADDADMPASTRIVNYLSILFGSLVGVTVGWLVYRRTMRRAKELALEEAAAVDGNGVLLADEFDYQDVEEGVMGPTQSRRLGESDSAALMDDDDISLWDASEGTLGLYRDDDDDDDDTNTSASPTMGPGRGGGDEVASRHTDTK